MQRQAAYTSMQAASAQAAEGVQQSKQRTAVLPRKKLPRAHSADGWMQDVWLAIKPLGDVAMRGLKGPRAYAAQLTRVSACSPCSTIIIMA